jgi:hypothetical protein
MLGAIMGKVDSMQEQVGKTSREMISLRENQKYTLEIKHL